MLAVSMAVLPVNMVCRGYDHKVYVRDVYILELFPFKIRSGPKPLFIDQNGLNFARDISIFCPKSALHLTINLFGNNSIFVWHIWPRIRPSVTVARHPGWGWVGEDLIARPAGLCYNIGVTRARTGPAL